MPRVPQHALTWSRADNSYELTARGRAEGRFGPGSDAAWQDWLATATSFAFRGASGSLNVYLEARPRGGRYWYAYHTARGRTIKRYLGRTASVSLARLEEAARALAEGPPPVCPTPVPAPCGADGEPPTTPPGAPDAADAVAALPSLPATKFIPPRPPGALVARERLLADLEAAVATPLTLLAAPAGWGKTTLLAAWARRRPDRVAWLSLEAADDDPARFWAAVVAALRTRVPGVGAAALALLRSPQPPPLAAVVTALLNELATADEGTAPLVLLLDDYQLIADPAIHESVRYCLAHLPARLHLLLASRIDPDLPLARLRARGQLAELRAAELRFTAGEAADFLGRALGAPLAEEDVLALARRTEGWAAGLQLAALALRGQGDRVAWLARFTGGHRYLLDYVEDEVLAPLPPATRRFLLQVAVLARLNAALCEAVTGEPASREILATLERANLFVVPLDEQRRWYRLHDLFREALLARAQASEPELLPEAHRRAARWHAAHGDAREAIAHALAAADHALAVALIEREAPRLWLGGEARAVHAWLHALPDDVFQRHASLALDAALRLLESSHGTVQASFARAQEQVEQTLARVEAVLREPQQPAARSVAAKPLGPLPEAEVATMQRRARLLRTLMATRAVLVRGDAERLRHLAREADALSEREAVRWRMIAHAVNYWLTESLQREGGLLIPRLLEAKRQAIAEGDQPAASRAMRWLAFAYVQAGRLHAAHDETLEALAIAERRGEHSMAAGYLHLGLAGVYYCWNRLEEAADSLEEMLRVARTWQSADLLIAEGASSALVSLAGGDLAAAQPALAGAEALVRQERFATHAPWVHAERVRYWLAAGDLDAARNWAEHAWFAPESFDPNRRGEFLALVRVYLVQRRYRQALEALERFAAQLDRPGAIPVAAGFLALRLVALHHAGDRTRAREVAARLFALTEPEGWLRVYLDEGAPMERALVALLDAPGGEGADTPALPRAYIAQLLAVFAQARQAARSPTPAAAPAPSTLAEPLTRREWEVLRHVAAGASNREIAAALAISPHTVKRHVANLLGKLGAGSRSGAVARAREAALL